VVHAIAAHHNEEEPRTIIAVLVQAAERSAPPARVRRESLENYIKRMQRLESIADSFQAVAKAYANPGRPRAAHHGRAAELNDNEAALMPAT
jgi:ribonuclease Y